MFRLRGVSLVYGPPGAGKTTFAAWYTYHNYKRVFWVSVFEDEAMFRRNTASFGYDFGGRLVFWEAPLAEPEAFFGTLLDAVARERPEALVIDSVTEVLALGGELGILHNVLYRAVKQSGVDVFLTAEKDVVSKVAYVADNVIELIYEVYLYGALREAVVRKIRGGKAGYSIPFIIREGRGIVFLAPEAPARTAAEQLSTGTCLDEAVGGVYKGLLHAIVGPVGAGKTWLMLKAATALREKGRGIIYIAVSGAGAVYAERFGVDTVDANLNLEELFAAVASADSDVVFIRGLEALSTLYGSSVLYMVLRILLQMARSGRAVVVSLRDLHDLDMLFDVIVKMEERSVIGVRGPQGRIGEKIKCWYVHYKSLVRFYGVLNFSLRTLVHYRVLAAFGKPFDYFLVEEPWRVHEVLEKAVGRHNAELVVNILTDWLKKNGCDVTRDQVLRYLTARETWG